MDLISSNSQQTEFEVDRLMDNWATLLNNMHEYVILIKDDNTIEFMNKSAISAFGNLCKQKCFNHLCINGDICNINCPEKNETLKKDEQTILKTTIGDKHLEYTAVVFRGYLGETLVMLVMRDITKPTQQEQEIRDFHLNLDDILQNKIHELHETEKIRKKLLQHVNLLHKKLQKRAYFDEMIGSSRKMFDLRNTIDQVAESNATILITGESGTGKELVANIIKECSDRSEKPFLKVNCNAINDSLLESNLFGYEKGSFTGATSLHKGKFEVVNSGTLFLDEIGDISPKMQAALLRVLENGEIIRVGGNKTISVDVRIIAATNRDLAALVKTGDFRLDLFYRLNIVVINIPPLRERKEDLVDLSTHFVKKYRKTFNKDISFLSENVIKRLFLHSWPGNVRELENVIQRAVLMAQNDAITEKDICTGDGITLTPSKDYLNQVCSQFGEKSLKEISADFEKEIILNCLRKNNANALETAKELKLGKTVFYAKMKRYNINPKTLKDNGFSS